MTICIHNQVGNTQGPTKFDITLGLKTVVAEIKEQISNTIVPSRPTNELSLNYKGNFLE